MELIFRQLFDPASSTYTYLLADRVTRDAVLIDPVFEQARRDAALVEELDLRLGWILDTHVHADHVTAAWLLRRRLGARIALAACSGAEGFDRGLGQGDRVEFGGRFLEVRATPGHTDGCLSYVLDDRSRVFTGDALLIRSAGRTDFQQGDAQTLYASIHEQIFTLPDGCSIYPAHDYRGLTSSSVAEEKRYNPRVNVQSSEADFVGYMENLGLPHPRQIDAAVPANLRCGRPDSDADLPGTDWAPVRYTYAGIHEIEAQWVADHRSGLQIVDVRGPDEYEGVLGHIEGALSIPLDGLRDRVGELSASAPTVAVCRSGARSAQAVGILEKAGFAQVANLAGGMIGWNGQRLPQARGGPGDA